MSVLKRISDLKYPSQDGLWTKCVIRFAQLQPAQRFAIDIFHQQGGMSATFDEIEDTDDIRVGESQSMLGFDLESGDGLFVPSERIRKKFQRHLSFYPGVEGQPDYTHSSLPKQSPQHEPAKFTTGSV